MDQDGKSVVCVATNIRPLSIICSPTCHKALVGVLSYVEDTFEGKNPIKQNAGHIFSIARISLA